MTAELRDYQVEPAMHALELFAERRKIADASEMGTGKTYVACWLAAQMEVPMFVVCPKIVVGPWKEVAEEFGVEMLGACTYGKVINGFEPYVTVEKSGKKKIFEWHLPDDALIVFDEAQNLKNPESQSAKVALKSSVGNRHYVLLASGTLAIDPTEMYVTGYLLGLHRLSNFRQWCKEHGCELVDSFYTRSGKVLEYKQSSNGVRKIHDALFPSRGIRIRKRDIPNFPSRNVEVVAISTEDENKQRSIWREMEEELNELARKELEDGEEPDPWTAVLRARQRAELGKVPYLEEMVRDAHREGYVCPVFVNFTATIEALAKRFETDCIVGSPANDEQRERSISDFQSGKSPIILVNTKAGGVGLSLHDVHGLAPRMSFISPTFSAVELVQCIDRIHRSGSHSPAEVRLVFLESGVEKKVCQKVKRKIGNLHKINDGDLQKPYELAINGSRTSTKRAVDIEGEFESNGDLLDTFFKI